MQKIKLGIIREEKVPPDSRVILTPRQCTELMKLYPNLEIRVETSEARSYSDAEYRAENIPLYNNVDDCDILAGVKEVPISKLVEGKTYMMFSHTHKKQAHNRDLLRAIVAKNIRVIDYELLTDDQGVRLIAFGFFAGLVGAHNALMAWGKRTGAYDLERMYTHLHFEELKDVYAKLQIPPVKIVVTGAGRVASGVTKVLDLMNIKKLTPEEYLDIDKPTEPVYVQLDSNRLYEHNFCMPYTNKNFFAHPYEYHSIFKHYWESSDLMINAIYWDQKAPKFFTKEDMKSNNFHIKVIGDITCDIEGSVPATIRATTIADPVMGYNPQTGEETKPYQDNCIDIMAVDNLPNELPRDASAAFGDQLLHSGVIEELLGLREPKAIHKATIAEDGHLNKHYKYLKNFLEG